MSGPMGSQSSHALMPMFDYQTFVLPLSISSSLPGGEATLPLIISPVAGALLSVKSFPNANCLSYPLDL